MMMVEMEIGARYRTRDGRKTGKLKSFPDKQYPFKAKIDGNSMEFTDTGKFSLKLHDHNLDLIEKLPPKVKKSDLETENRELRDKLKAAEEHAQDLMGNLHSTAETLERVRIEINKMEWLKNPWMSRIRDLAGDAPAPETPGTPDAEPELLPDYEGIAESVMERFGLDPQSFKFLVQTIKDGNASREAKIARTQPPRVPDEKLVEGIVSVVLDFAATWGGVSVLEVQQVEEKYDNKLQKYLRSVLLLSEPRREIVSWVNVYRHVEDGIYIGSRIFDTEMQAMRIAKTMLDTSRSTYITTVPIAIPATPTGETK